MPTRLLDWASGHSLRAALVIGLLTLAVVLPGLGALPVTDRDEARFAQATKQMLETGDLIDIRFQDDPRWKKPVGIYWLQAAAVAGVGEGTAASIRAYRIPSAVAGVLGAVLLAWAARPLVSARAATLAGMMLGTTILLGAEANIAKTDAALMATAVAAMGGMTHALFGTGRLWHAAVFWVAISAAILIKGPIVPLIAALALATVWIVPGGPRPSLRPLRPLAGPGLTVILCAPWLIAIWQVSDGAFFTEAVGRDLLGKVAEGHEKHWGPPGLYTAIVWGTFWPWAALLPLALPWLWRNRREGWVLFLAGWVVPFWLILEAVPTKLPHYVLPLYPALAIALAAWAVSGAGGAARWQRIASAVLVALPPVAVAAAIPVLPLLVGAPVSLPAAILGAGAAALGILAARAALAGQTGRQILVSIATAVVLYPAILQFALPGLAPQVFPSPVIAAAWDRLAACANGPLVSTTYREPSLVFHAGTETRFVQPQQAARAGARPGTVVLHEERRTEGWTGLTAPEGLVQRSPTILFFNYNRGKPYAAALFTADDPRWDACVTGAPAG